MRKLADKEHH